MPTTARTAGPGPDQDSAVVVVAGGKFATPVPEPAVELVSVELRDRVDPVAGLVTSLFVVDAELVTDALAEDDAAVVLDATVPPRPWLGPTTMKIEDELARYPAFKAEASMTSDPSKVLGIVNVPEKTPALLVSTMSGGNSLRLSDMTTVAPETAFCAGDQA
jgi:hypothetical protein